MHSVSFILSLVFLERGIFLCLCPLSPVFLERGIFMCLCPLSPVFHLFMCSFLTVLLLQRCKSPCNVLFILPLVFLERRIFMFLCTLSQCFRYNSLWTNRPPGMLLLMRCDFPIDNSHVSVRVHLTNRKNPSNRQRWTAGSVVSNEMRFSDRQHPSFGSCPFDESDESIDPTGFLASLQLMRCNFPFDNE